MHDFDLESVGGSSSVNLYIHSKMHALRDWAWELLKYRQNKSLSEP